MADYDSRLLLLNEDEFKKLNFQQNPNQKQSLIDDEPDELDTLEINEEGFVVVPDERRNLILSEDQDMRILSMVLIQKTSMLPIKTSIYEYTKRLKTMIQ
jgi:hypothetical protein